MTEKVVMETECCNTVGSLSSTEVKRSKAPGEAGSDSPSTGTVFQGGDGAGDEKKQVPEVDVLD